MVHWRLPLRKPMERSMSYEAESDNDKSGAGHILLVCYSIINMNN